MPIIEVLQASIDPADQSEFRILVDRKHIKYINIDPGLYDVPDMCFGPSLASYYHLYHPAIGTLVTYQRTPLRDVPDSSGMRRSSLLGSRTFGIHF